MSTLKPPPKEHAAREQWSSPYGFILAAVGSAVGLGNIWRFPGVAYENGGGAFLVPYLVALLVAGVPILLLDYSLGHRYRGSSPAVFRRIGRRFEPLGWFHVAISFVIITYYAVILAWAIRYTMFSVNLAWGDDTVGFFVGEYLQLGDPAFNLDVVGGVFWPLLAIWVVAAIVMARGVTRGVELANRLFLPLLTIMFLALVVRAMFLPGASDGLNQFFTPNWGALADAGVWIAAFSQIFFSLSIAFGIMITYSSYLPRRSNLAPTGFVTAFANSSFELLAGFGVFATLGFMAFQQGVGVGELSGIKGVALSFMTFPQVISMMPGGPVFGVLFFGSLVLAGFTSLISLLQVVSAALQEKFGIRRQVASLVVTGTTGLLSVVLFSTTNGLNALDVVDKFANEVGIVIAAIALTLVVGLGLRMLPTLRTHLNRTSTARVGKWWDIAVGIVNPLMLIVMFGITLAALLREGYGGYPTSFVGIFGWGAFAFMVVAAFGFSAIPWRTPVDDFDPVRVHDRADDALVDAPEPLRVETLERLSDDDEGGRR